MYANNAIRTRVHKNMPFEPLSDDEWRPVARLFQADDDRRRFGRPRRNPREVLDAILWVLTQGERWRRIPQGMPPAQTCYIKYLQWRRDGTWDEIAARLEARLAGCCSPTCEKDDD